MIPVNEKVDDRARKMLEDTNALSLPVDLDKILAALELELRINPMGEEYSGFLAVDKHMIVVNERHPHVRRRFTIAHEIGHYDLHRRDRDPADVFVDRAAYFGDEDEREVYFRHNRLGIADYRMEAEANAYAAGLLMPKELLDRYLEQHADKIDLSKAEDIRMVAEAFDVSWPAMGYRLRNFGFGVRTSF